MAGFVGDRGSSDGVPVVVGPPTAANLAELRRRLPWLRPIPLGTRLSAGFGDRLGVATPGHVRALRSAGRGIAPVFAQQSIREMERTHRTPQQVLDEATWGAFCAGWQAGFGADADHVKTAADVDRCVAAGYTLFTFDPGEHVDPDPFPERVVWEELQDRRFDLLHRYRGFDPRVVLLAASKYGRAVAHCARLYRHLASAAAHRFDVEISVDETGSPTSPLEHRYFAAELHRLGVPFVSLAPRFVGRFEKGVDYIGDLREFAAVFAEHVAIARELGPYKLSLHSGSDKFSIFGAAAAAAGELVHLKTAGTSYLEALRTVARVSPDLFRTIYAFARERYPVDRATYHVSADLARTPPGDALPEAELPGLLDDFDARQVLHVTFGSVLSRWQPELLEALRAHLEAYWLDLERHFSRHLAPFARVGP